MNRSARDIMQTGIVTVSPSDPLDSVQQLFAEEAIHGAPVVDETGRVLGVISTSDLLRAVVSEREAGRPELSYFRDGVETPVWPERGALPGISESCVEDAMTKGVVCVEPVASIQDVAQTLCTHRIHRVLVMEDARLLGIISSFDLMALFQADPG